jgi:hypothetical protein
MKVLILVLLVVFAASVTAVQDPATSSDAPGVKVISNSWRREVNNPALLEDPTVVNQTRTPTERAQKDVNQNSNYPVPANRLLIPDAPKGPKVQPQNSGPGVHYVYEIKVLNSGDQTIRRLSWDFDLLEPNTGREVGHHTFTSAKTIRTGQTAKLVGRSALNPVSLIDVKKTDRKSSHEYPVRVTIKRIEYDQGPTWMRSSN